MYWEYKIKNYLSEGHFYKPFLCKANWTSRHINIMQRLLNLKVESEGFVRAVPKRTRTLADC